MVGRYRQIKNEREARERRTKRFDEIRSRDPDGYVRWLMKCFPAPPPETGLKVTIKKKD